MAAVACTVSLLACSGKTVSGDDGDGGGGGSSGGGIAGACDDYFKAAFSGSCPGTLNPPPSEVSHIESRFDTLCADALALPGVGITPDTLEACVAAIKSTSCAVLDDESGVCNLGVSGSLGASAPCISESQCATGDCSAGSSAPDGGTLVCGTCVTPVPLGGSCANGQSCGPNASCSGAETCVAPTIVAAGGACNTAEEQCASGLQCNTDFVCATPGGAGTTCLEDEQCAAPLVCPEVSGTSTCQAAGAAGAPCNSAAECVSGLGCDFSAHQCTAVTWVAAGQPCNSGSIECLVGSCTIEGTGSTGTCPTVIADGQPCHTDDITTTCDVFAQCTAGVCLLGYPSCP